MSGATVPTTGALPDAAWIAALLSLPGLGPNRLAGLLATDDPSSIWERLCSGAPVRVERVSAETVEAWRSTARGFDVADRWAATRSLGISVAALGRDGYPRRLDGDPEPPQLLFRTGSPLSAAPTVAIVGTRKCTNYGVRMAFRLGAALAGSGISVVSGLALGIDAAAHEGALSVADGVPPVAVVGSGLDVVYPKRNAGLWRRLAERGTILSEAPPGAAPDAWRFPARNRIIAGLADAVVVVESRDSGGSLLTVDEAQLRDVPVGAVPGPVTSRASSGTNRLLVDGATPVVDTDDVLAMLGHPGAHGEAVSAASASGGERTPQSALRDPELLDALGWGPVLIDQLCLRLGGGPLDVARRVEMLVAAGVIQQTGPWIERLR